MVEGSLPGLEEVLVRLVAPAESGGWQRVPAYHLNAKRRWELLEAVECAWELPHREVGLECVVERLVVSDKDRSIALPAFGREQREPRDVASEPPVRLQRFREEPVGLDQGLTISGN